MPPFIKFTQSKLTDGTPSTVVFINASDIVHANYNVQNKTLRLALGHYKGHSPAGDFTLEGEEALAALEILQKL